MADKSLHPAVADVLQHFEYEHLPAHLRVVSQPFSNLAHWLAEELSGPELTVGLRKLLEAKDCAVRAAVASNKQVKPAWTTESGVTFQPPK